jgi:hypothetical protein
VRLIRLDPITSSAMAKVSLYGNIFAVMGQTDRPDPYFFQSRKPQIYIVPVTKSTRNPKVCLGDNYVAPDGPTNLGAMWIQSENDPHFDIEDHIPQRGKRT